MLQNLPFPRQVLDKQTSPKSPSVSQSNSAPTTSSTNPPPASAALALTKAFTSTVTYTNLISRTTKDHYFIAHASTTISRTLLVAGIILLKLLRSNHATHVDIEVGKKAFNLVLKLFRYASLGDNDLEMRAVNVLTQLWTLHTSHAAPPGQREYDYGCAVDLEGEL